MKRDEERFSLILIRSSDDPPTHSEEFQEGLSTFTRSLRAHGIEFSARACMMESASGGGYSLGEYGIIAASIGPILSGAIGAWLHAKYGRKVKLKLKDITLEAATPEEVEKLMKMAEKHQKKSGQKS